MQRGAAGRVCPVQESSRVVRRLTRAHVSHEVVVATQPAISGLHAVCRQHRAHIWQHGRRLCSRLVGLCRPGLERRGLAAGSVEQRCCSARLVACRACCHHDRHRRHWHVLSQRQRPLDALGHVFYLLPAATSLTAATFMSAPGRTSCWSSPALVYSTMCTGTGRRSANTRRACSMCTAYAWHRFACSARRTRGAAPHALRSWPSMQPSVQPAILIARLRRAASKRWTLSFSAECIKAKVEGGALSTPSTPRCCVSDRGCKTYIAVMLLGSAAPSAARALSARWQRALAPALRTAGGSRTLAWATAAPPGRASTTAADAQATRHAKTTTRVSHLPRCMRARAYDSAGGAPCAACGDPGRARAGRGTGCRAAGTWPRGCRWPG